ncbi:MAG: 2-C-methyl-D-erythritol 4-phosphate cytidylyltransferase [Clostridia bacterium]|nr:2-C-methyl-D-erythritol 4-phosphate cytidylyltransferase [Clostridia bacterium]
MKRKRRLAGLFSGVLRVALRRRPKTFGVILAAGSGTRMGTDVPKQFLSLCGKPILVWSARAFLDCPEIDGIVIVTRRKDIAAVEEICRQYGLSGKPIRVVSGGDSRQRSAFLGVEATPKGCRFVAIHDAARCLVTPETVSAVVNEAYRRRAATAVYPIADTVKRIDARGRIRETLDRSELVAAATPQAFDRDFYIAVAAYAEKKGIAVTDDNALFEAVGQTVYTVDCGNGNFKITTQADLDRAEAILRARKTGKETEE